MTQRPLDKCYITSQGQYVIKKKTGYKSQDEKNHYEALFFLDKINSDGTIDKNIEFSLTNPHLQEFEN